MWGKVGSTDRLREMKRTKFTIGTIFTNFNYIKMTV